MTREDILAMKPGRELDALVADKIFKWINVNYKTGHGDKPNYYGFYGVAVPNYSTDIAAAWEVVEKMRDLHYGSAELYRFHDNEWLSKFVCNYGPCPYHNNQKHNWHGSSAQCKTAPEAICKAALLAVQDD